MVALIANQNQIMLQQQQQVHQTSTQNQKGFKKLPAHIQKMWLNASSLTPKTGMDANGDPIGGQVRTEPTAQCKEFFDSSTLSLAKQTLIFSVHQRFNVQVAISEGSVAALREGLILNIATGHLGPVSLFSIGEEDITAANYSITNDISELLEMHIARTDGVGLSENQVKKSAKVAYYVPTNVEEGQRQLIGCAAVMAYLFDEDGSTSSIKRLLASFIEHIEKNKTNYMLLQSRRPEFMMELISLLNAHVQIHLKRCATTKLGERADDRMLDTAAADIQQEIIFARFSPPAIPVVLRAAFNLTLQKQQRYLPLPPPPPTSQYQLQGQNYQQHGQNHQQPGPNKRGKFGGDRVRGTPTFNKAVKEEYSSKAAKAWGPFLNASKQQSFPELAGVPVCLNFHVRGKCDSLCPRENTHKALNTAMYNKLWDSTIAALGSL
jgi:hypothetical protein